MIVKDLKTYKDDCYAALSRDLTEFEKNFLLVSGGILTFSISFIKDIIKIANAEFLAFLFIGWGSIIVSIGIMMYAFLKSADASDHLWKLTDDFIVENSLYNEAENLSDSQAKAIKSKTSPFLNKSKGRLKNLRRWAVGFFLLGVFSFSLFVSINLVLEKKTSSHKIEKPIKDIFLNDSFSLMIL
jgi:hypothetical protein